MSDEDEKGILDEAVKRGDVIAKIYDGSASTLAGIERSKNRPWRNENRLVGRPLTNETNEVLDEILAKVKKQIIKEGTCGK